MDNAHTSPLRSPAVAVLDRLDSWKLIAAYLGRAVRSVQRWERQEALPVHRHRHPKGSSVYAFKHEIDAWLLDRFAANALAPSSQRGMPVQSLTRDLSITQRPSRSPVQFAAASPAAR